MNTSTFRRFLIISAIATCILVISGGVVRMVVGEQGCPDWPLCYGQIVPPPQMYAWIDYLHRLLALLVVALIGISGWIAWRRQDADPWVRRPPLLAPLAVLVQVGLGGLIVRTDMPELIRMFHLGLAMLVLACLIIPAVALTVADEGRRTPNMRVGGRTMQQARRYRQVISGAALAVALLVLTSAGIAEAAVYGETSMPQMSGLLARSHQGAVLMAGLFGLGMCWSTWRTRRQDRMLLGGVLLTSGLLFVSIAVPVLTANRAILMPSLASVMTGLHLVLWSAVVALSILALRRPLPVVAHVPSPDLVGLPARRPTLLNDYISLTKPKVIMLLLVTTLTTMFITDAGMPSLALIFWTMLGGYLAAGGAGAINCAFDHDIDINMGRTSRRPVPSGRISGRNALLFGLALCVLGFVVLATFTTMLAAILAMIGAVYYAFFYTRWLKRSTWQNIVIGGGAGSIPPLVGWAAMTGTLTLPAVLLFVIIFYWTPPHFWALALVKQKDYARAGIPMLPVVAGQRETHWQIWLYSLIMVAMSLLLTPLHAMGMIYLILALLLGAVFLRYAWNVWRAGEQSHIWGLYKYSLLYLALLFAAMVLDRVLLA